MTRRYWKAFGTLAFLELAALFVVAMLLASGR